MCPLIETPAVVFLIVELVSRSLGIPVDIIEPAGFVIDDKRLKRASMDYYDYLELKKHLSWEKFYEWSKDNSYRLILLTTKTKKSYKICKW